MTPKLKRYGELKRSIIDHYDSTFSSFDEGATAEFRGDLYDYAQRHADKWSVRVSVTEMLKVLMERYEPLVESDGEWKALEGLFPPHNHMWVEFDAPVLTPDGPIGGAFFMHLNQGDDATALTAQHKQWTEEKIARLKVHVGVYTEQLWGVEWLNGDCTELVRQVLFYPDRSVGRRWEGNPWDDCPHGACFPQSGELCERCRAALRFIPRWATLLQATFSGFFQEIELKEQMREERRSQKKQGNPKKKVYSLERLLFKTVDVSRRQIAMTYEEQAELNKEKYSWVAGHPVLPFDAIDWAIRQMMMR